MPNEKNPGPWISAAATRRMLKVSNGKLVGLAEQGLLGTYSLPGSPPRYRRDDVERMIEAATKPATVTAN